MNRLTTLSLPVLLAVSASATLAADPRVGEWALTVPSGEAGWLGIREENGKLVGDLMWAVGHATRLTDAKFDKDSFTFNFKEQYGPNRHAVTLKFDGDAAQGTDESVAPDGKKTDGRLTGKRQPPMPPRPDLEKVKFGEPVVLFNGKDLTGWRPNEPNRVSGWKVVDGVMANETARRNVGGHGDQANIRSDREFVDFKLHIEFRTPPVGGNSGIYLRGLYEIQTTDSKSGGGATDRGAGSVYGRVKPTENAALPPGEWQTYDLTLVDRHVTVVYNGKKVIDNQPVLGCTGGALSSDVMKPGPIYLQGDHTPIEYRNIVVTPVVK